MYILLAIGSSLHATIAYSQNFAATEEVIPCYTYCSYILHTTRIWGGDYGVRHQYHIEYEQLKGWVRPR